MIPRLHVIVAHEARVAAVFRRGPTKVFSLYRWDMAKDTIKAGQWFNGRIFVSSSDLSPDGRYMIYQADKGVSKTRDVGSTWTSVSKPPWLTAVDLFQNDPWDLGGGEFIDASSYRTWANRKRVGAGLSGLDHVATGDTSANASNRTESYLRRLRKEGWKSDAARVGDGKVFLKVLPAGGHLYRRVNASGWEDVFTLKSSDEFEVYLDEGEHLVTDWDWADLDGPDIVFAKSGGLWRWNPSCSNVSEAKLVRDFCEDKFTEVKAPYPGVREKSS